VERLLPSGFTFAHFVNAFRGAAWDSLFSSLVVGFCASLFALLCGMWAALALRQLARSCKNILGWRFICPAPFLPFPWGWDSGGLQPGAAADERHLLYRTGGALRADFGIYLQQRLHRAGADFAGY
jgi:hypothetical protein